MSMLQQVTPEIVRPYTVRNTHTTTGGQMITSLSFKGNDLLITGSRDTQVSKTLILYNYINPGSPGSQ